MASSADRGKSAEDLLKRRLVEVCKLQGREYFRLPDARAGSLQATLADFLMVDNGKAYLIECKQVDHAYRLPHGNFDTGQVGRMRLFKFAGAGCIVLIYHTPLNLWRGYDIDRFIDRSEGGSWDLRDTEPKALAALLK